MQKEQHMASTTTSLISREILATVAAGALYPFGRIGAARRTRKEKDLRTVVFVHGYGGNPSCFLPLMSYLRAHGVRNFLFFSYQGNAGIEKAAVALRQFIRERVRGGRIDLVCHSMGGLVARLYLQELGGARRTNHCITIGTPVRGTYTAFWLPNRIGRDLQPGSDLLRRIKTRRQLAATVRFVSVIGDRDQIVLPRTFATDHQEETVTIEGTGHLGLLFSPQVCRTVLTVLAPVPARFPRFGTGNGDQHSA
jgi:pimeloyl-ACP methyl ester carboxylesterase